MSKIYKGSNHYIEQAKEYSSGTEYLQAYSYSALVGVAYNNIAIMTTRKYSNTTSKHMGKLSWEFRKLGCSIIYLPDQYIQFKTLSNWAGKESSLMLTDSTVDAFDIPSILMTNKLWLRQEDLNDVFERSNRSDVALLMHILYKFQRRKSLREYMYEHVYQWISERKDAIKQTAERYALEERPKIDAIDKRIASLRKKEAKLIGMSNAPLKAFKLTTEVVCWMRRVKTCRYSQEQMISAIRRGDSLHDVTISDYDTALQKAQEYPESITPYIAQGLELIKQWEANDWTEINNVSNKIVELNKEHKQITNLTEYLTLGVK